MKVSNFYCHTCLRSVASQEAQGKKHKNCGGKVTWRTVDTEQLERVVSDEDKTVPV